MATVLWRNLLEITRCIGYVLVQQIIKAAVYLFVSQPTGFGRKVL